MEKIEFKEFYTDEDNPVILKMKNSLKWIIFNVPDAGMVTGFPRLMINFIIIGISAFIFSQLLLGRANIFEFILCSIISGFIGGLFFIKTFALSLLKTLEKYQGICGFLEETVKNTQ